MNHFKLYVLRKYKFDITSAFTEILALLWKQFLKLVFFFLQKAEEDDYREWLKGQRSEPEEDAGDLVILGKVDSGNVGVGFGENGRCGGKIC